MLNRQGKCAVMWMCLLCWGNMETEVQYKYMLTSTSR
ncbi:MAG: hypothetical protein ACI9MS_001166 [Glaciecola sp.]|jgi:hypothetical protein